MGAIGHVHDKEGFDNAFVIIDDEGTVDPDDDTVDFVIGGGEGEDDADALRWAVGAGLNLNLPFFGLGFNSQATYAKGAIGYATSDPAGRRYFGGFNSGDFIGPDADDSLTEAWNVRAGITGSFTERWGFLLDGSYTEVDTDEQTVTALADVGDDDGVLEEVEVELSGLDYTHYAVVGTVTYTPVPGLLFGWEVGYNHLEFEDRDQAVLLDNPTTEVTAQEQDVFGAMFRVQRDF